jgi:hypothetical protein
MKKFVLIAVLGMGLAAPALAVDGGAVIGGAIGGGTGAAVGSAIGGKEGAIVGGAIGGAVGAAIGSSGSKETVVVREVEVRRPGPPPHAPAHGRRNK